MRFGLAVLAFAGLAACGSEPEQEPAAAAAEVTPAAVTFDGAGAQNRASMLTHGERLSWVLGCRGCHGPDLEGRSLDDDPQGYGVLWASNLTHSVPAMSDAGLDALLRKGVHPFRPEMWIMPSENFQHLSDPDLAALIAHLRTLRPAGEPSPQPVLGPKARAEIQAGAIKAAAELVSDPGYALPRDLGPASARGRYIASLTCAECHGGQLQGGRDAPDLTIAGAYSREEFERLLTRGVPSGNRKLKNELMAVVAKSRYSKMTVAERDALHAYLKARSEQPQ